MTLSTAFMDELRARTSLTSLIERKVKLTKAGTEKRGCCPFHSEKSPSFYVNDDKGFYHCFGCSAHGDAIRWMTDHEKLPFMDAVKELAAAAGMEMPAQDSRYAEREREQAAMFDIMARAADWFADNMTDPVASGGAPAAYLDKRGIAAQVEPFLIGWAPGGRNAEPLHRHLKDVAPAMLVKLGLAKISDQPGREGEVFDFFRARITFPIRDQRGRVIGFGGRVIGDAEPKYLNSPDTPIFDKGQTLYNIDRAGPAARKAERLIVVEGYMDVIGLATVGIEEAVAPNGTALTERQISRLWRLANTPILCFDGDKAGRAAAARAAVRALPLLEPDRSLSFCTPPDGSDPFDVARSGGLVAVEAMLKATRALVDVVWDHEVAAGPIDTPEQKAGLASRLREHAGTIRNADVRAAYMREFRARFERHTARPAEPRRAARQPSAPTERQPFSRPARPQSQASKAIARTGNGLNVERAVLAGLLRYPDVAGTAMEATCLAKFSHPNAEALRDALVDAAVARQPFELSADLQPVADYVRGGPLRFSFTVGHDDPIAAQRARQDLADALHALRR